MLYLIPLAEILAKELRRLRRERWADEEFEALERRVWRERDFDDLGYLRIKGARKIDATSLSVLRELYLMRDAKAREKDRLPFKVLGISQTSKVVIKVFDILGNEIATLIDDEKSIGTYELTWSAENLPSGVYFYQLRTGDFIQTRKMILLK